MKASKVYTIATAQVSETAHLGIIVRGILIDNTIYDFARGLTYVIDPVTIIIEKNYEKD